MTDNDIEAIIKKTAVETVRQLRVQGALKDSKSIVYAHMSRMLRDYFENNRENDRLRQALDKLRDDAYFDIIPLYYYSNNTIEHIASGFEVDASTITRNKKRLCYEIYELMGEENV